MVLKKATSRLSNSICLVSSFWENKNKGKIKNKKNLGILQWLVKQCYLFNVDVKSMYLLGQATEQYTSFVWNREINFTLVFVLKENEDVLFLFCYFIETHFLLIEELF